MTRPKQSSLLRVRIIPHNIFVENYKIYTSGPTIKAVNNRKKDVIDLITKAGGNCLGRASHIIFYILIELAVHMACLKKSTG